ncbi:PDR/VanB family oxidoreductase [Aeromicrobium ginsengisoli]|uniref:Oxidoreductase n=1 Tax=Aeromicrobium ginsengisoli TaxID=363867 RepID=A0A5M4F999_9ACTN|nr:PDR/VanB family oxidoreductase [Aeromicrobium ginsengisoli]KAA1394288.1 oxidoreductase [Aeromicrobium ginsengisoli]
MHEESKIATRVVTRTEAADGVLTIELGSTDGTDLPAWSPGAHIDLDLAPDLTRQYSLCGDPDNRARWRIGVLREPSSRGGSSHVHDRLFPGTDVTARGPRNHFALEPSDHYVFIAGGIGITPILPMVREAQRRGATWELHYGGRSRSSMAFRDELEMLGGGEVELHPQDERGLLDLQGILGTPRADALVYCCGPEPLLYAVEAATAAWPSGALHVERFAPKGFNEPASADAFEVELAESGLTITVTPDQSILEAVRASGVEAWSSCEEGTCGTCETVVLAGEPDHRDSVLSPDEQASNETMMICVSRAACPKLTLEL